VFVVAAAYPLWVGDITTTYGAGVIGTRTNKATRAPTRVVRWSYPAAARVGYLSRILIRRYVFHNSLGLAPSGAAHVAPPHWVRSHARTVRHTLRLGCQEAGGVTRYRSQRPP
jgi:hypothetical protein